MTYQRILSRNALRDGSYDKEPSGWPLTGVNTKPEAMAAWLTDLGRSIEATTARLRSLTGDLRRLEADAVDERSICEQVSRRSGIAPDVVAAVLKEFLSL